MGSTLQGLLSVRPQRDTSVRCGYHDGPKLRPQRTSSPALHSLLHGTSREAILVRRRWRRGFNVRLSVPATRRRLRGEGDKGVALMEYVEPRSSTSSMWARAEPSNRALEVSPWIDNHLTRIRQTIPLDTVTRRDDPLRPFQAESSSHEASHERRKC